MWAPALRPKQNEALSHKGCPPLQSCRAGFELPSCPTTWQSNSPLYTIPYRLPGVPVPSPTPPQTSRRSSTLLECWEGAKGWLQHRQGINQFAVSYKESAPGLPCSWLWEGTSVQCGFQCLNKTISLLELLMLPAMPYLKYFLAS